jgi:ATP synthase subunit 6
MNFILFSPLEQFQILPLIPIYFGMFDISITNETIIFSIVLIFSWLLYTGISKNSNSGYFLVPNRVQLVVETFYNFIAVQISDNLMSNKAKELFPVIFTVFFLVLSLNLIGLVPYSFTLTSHLAVTLCFSLSLFIGVNILAFKYHGVRFFSLFLPAGTSAVLALLLVPIELISYIFRPISLATRLFANMMAGHTLLKVIAGFGYTLMSNTGVLFLFHYVPLIVLIPLFGLEIAVAFIQSFVFMILLCIYLYDSIHLH